MREWLDVSLAVDEDSLDERWDGEVVLDEELRLLARENRLSLWRSEPQRLDLGDGVAAVELTLRCVVHAHPECRFRWVRLNVDFAGLPEAQVADMSPRDDISTGPVKLVTTRSAELSYAIESVPVAPGLAIDRDVYLPRLTASGRRFQYASWDFAALGDTPLHVDRDLRILLSVPAVATAVPVRVTLRGRVTVAGRRGAIPLLGRRTGEFAVQQQPAISHPGAESPATPGASQIRSATNTPDPAASGEAVPHRPPRIFISYAQDDAEHMEAVRQLRDLLHKTIGVAAEWDQNAAERPQEWSLWAQRQIEQADFILVIGSPAYRTRAEGRAAPGTGRGVQWEARLIRELAYADSEAALAKVLPVVLPGRSTEDLPGWLGPYTCTHYLVSDFTAAGAQDLLKYLTGGAA